MAKCPSNQCGGRESEYFHFAIAGTRPGEHFPTIFLYSLASRPPWDCATRVEGNIMEKDAMELEFPNLWRNVNSVTFHDDVITQILPSPLEQVNCAQSPIGNTILK
jgi:hypothetical protein